MYASLLSDNKFQEFYKIFCLSLFMPILQPLLHLFVTEKGWEHSSHVSCMWKLCTDERNKMNTYWVQVLPEQHSKDQILTTVKRYGKSCLCSRSVSSHFVWINDTSLTFSTMKGDHFDIVLDRLDTLVPHLKHWNNVKQNRGRNAYSTRCL
jgi:hypothetical protein